MLEQKQTVKRAEPPGVQIGLPTLLVCPPCCFVCVSPSKICVVPVLVQVLLLVLVLGTSRSFATTRSRRGIRAYVYCLCVPLSKICVCIRGYVELKPCSRSLYRVSLSVHMPCRCTAIFSDRTGLDNSFSYSDTTYRYT